jgi:HEAT repeat protein
VFWWEFNKAGFLQLKSKISNAGNFTEIGGLVGLGYGARTSHTLAPSAADRENIILPALVNLIEQEGNRDVATAVLVALARVGLQPEQARQIFAKHLDAPVQEVGETAALAYGILGDELSIPLLEGLLLDRKEAQKIVGRSEVPFRSRTFAAYSLGLIGRSSADERIKVEVATILLQTLRSDASAAKDIRVACVISLGVLKLDDPTETVRELREILDSDQDSEIVLAHIPNAMAKLLREVPAGDSMRTETMDQLLKILSNKPKRKVLIRQSAVQAVGMMATPNDARNQDIFRTLQFLSKKGRDQQLKHFTAIAMAHLGSAAPEMRKPVTQFLMAQMKKSSTSYEPWCGLALGVLAFQLQKQGGTLPLVAMEATLTAFKRCKAPDRKAAFALALGLMNYVEGAEEIRDSMTRIQDSQFRGYAAVSLGLLNSRKYMELITDIVTESKRDPDLLKQASIGLGLMKDRNAVGLLLDYLEPQKGKRPRLAVLSAVATALGFIGDKSAVTPLIHTMAQERIAHLGRAFAAVALGMVADQHDLPWNSVFSENLNYRAAVSTLVDQQTGTGILDIL